jgi:hypothetical protein
MNVISLCLIRTKFNQHFPFVTTCYNKYIILDRYSNFKSTQEPNTPIWKSRILSMKK